MRWVAVASTAGGLGGTSLALVTGVRQSPERRTLVVDASPWPGSLAGAARQFGLDLVPVGPDLLRASRGAATVDLWSPERRHDGSCDLGEVVLVTGGYDLAIWDLGGLEAPWRRGVWSRAAQRWLLVRRGEGGLRGADDGTREVDSIDVVAATRTAANEHTLDALLALVLRETTGCWARPRGLLDLSTLEADVAEGRLPDLPKRMTAVAPAGEPPPLRAADPHRWLLGMTGSSAAAEGERAYRAIWEALRRDAGHRVPVVPASVRAELSRRLEEARASFETQVVPRPARPTARGPGRAVREARERRGIGQRELSLETRIGIRYLEAIESMEVEALPRAVYLRAYVREVARVLGLDEERFVEDYLRAVEVLRTRPPLRRSPSAGGTEEPRRPEDEQDHLD